MWRSPEPGLAACKTAEVLRKLPDCINEVAPPGHNQISQRTWLAERLLLTHGRIRAVRARPWRRLDQFMLGIPGCQWDHPTWHSGEHRASEEVPSPVFSSD